MSGLEPVQGEHVCDFCVTTVDKFAVRSKSTGKIVCHNCIYAMKVNLGIIPDGALCCLKCGFYKSVMVKYAGGARVLFVHQGQDKRDTAIYSPVGVSRSWDRRTDKFLAAHCGKCLTQLPFKLVWESLYILSRDQRAAPVPSGDVA